MFAVQDFQRGFDTWFAEVPIIRPVVFLQHSDQLRYIHIVVVVKMAEPPLEIKYNQIKHEYQKKTGTKHVTGKEGGCDSTQFIKMTVTMDVALLRDQKIRVVPSKRNQVP